MPDFTRMYARQEYLTPGAAEAVEMVAETVEPGENTVLLDVASGKGEAAATLAGRFACRVITVDLFDPFVHYAAAKFWHFNLRDLVCQVRANGTRLPIRDNSVDAAYCIGAPSIVGLEASLAEMARAVRSGGYVIATDAVWHSKPEGPLAKSGVGLPRPRRSAVDEYAALIESTGLQVERKVVFPRSAWEDYFAPMLQVANDARTGEARDPFFADEIEETVALERRAVEAYLDYAAFIARKP